MRVRVVSQMGCSLVVALRVMGMRVVRVLVVVMVLVLLLVMLVLVVGSRSCRHRGGGHRGRVVLHHGGRLGHGRGRAHRRTVLLLVSLLLVKPVAVRYCRCRRPQSR